MKKLKNSLLFTFFYYLIIMFLANYFIIDREDGLVSGFVHALIVALFMTFMHRYIYEENIPVYLKLKDYENVMQELDAIGTTFIKEKGEKKYYRINSANWGFNKIIVKKTPFYLYVEAPKKFRDNFLKLQA